MNIKKFKIRYILIAWVVIYILVSLFKYIKIKSLIYDRYGIVSKTFSTKMYINESVLVDGVLLIIGFPVLLLSGGWNFTQWAYRDIELDFSKKLTTYAELKAPFMQEKFQVTMRGGKIVSDTFTSTLATDPKFQHLYSEWVKKQVGIEDENVEFKFAGNFDPPYIEFNKITSLSDDYREIFENTHNLYAWLCEASNIKDLNNDNKLKVAKSVREEYLLKVITLTSLPMGKNFGGRVYISSSENARDKDNGYVFDFDIINENDSNSEMIERK